MTSSAFSNDDDRWAAAQRRDPAAEGAFLMGVLTTGVYCLPTCAGRPKRENVRFYGTAEAARASGLRPCKRCKPDEQRETLRYGFVETDLGTALLAASGAGVCVVTLGEDRAGLAADLRRRFPRARLIEAGAELSTELEQARALISSPAAGFAPALDARGTPFQQAVWRALRQLPAGTTVSYAELARRAGRPEATRAAAQACGANPLAVITPCHRVVRADGSLSGYRWGVERKRALLARERAA
ncbi:transcriptional regulator [Caulobacter sp. CCUG 60055]|uniref:methylated-DNA--[protein]-cysteine S-methyltransferase n=1 Tax=Caulobacter sp. CCUG 60055 TaxID=2100090 RepID=UPI001FA80069|nr:methylated-DNA--[protein]-cysteine S-methyltransferase [Caulobacter sp. CCUG 60055]MCI3181898.1 transcriptional regulator [Caulobacter sp. CCUG 60055]